MASKARPVNQFNRLIYVSGTEPVGTYKLGSRWNHTHINPRTGRVEAYDGKNCTPSVGCVMVDAQTGGRITSNPVQLRNAQDDWDGGIGWDDVNVATQKLWGITFATPRGFDWGDVLDVVRDDRFVGIQGDNDQIGPYTCQVGGTFTHAYGIGGYRSSDSRILWYDPLCHHARWIPQSNARAAAEKLAMAEGRSRGDLFVAYTKVMAPRYNAGVTLRYGAYPVGAGRYLARRDDVPVRSGPGTQYPKVAELDHRESFAARQAKRVGGRWYGTADGRRWCYTDVLWYAGPIVGNETIS